MAQAVEKAAVLAQRGIHHTRLIPHGVDRAVFPVPAASRVWAGGLLRLGLVSRRYDRGVKGEDLLLALLDRLDSARVSFVLAGEGRWRDAETLRARGFAVDHYERLPYRLMGRLYAGIDALLIPSRSEGGPACLPEALGIGVPVLCRPVGMCPDWVRDGDNGLILTGGAVEDGARIMALLDGGGRGLDRLNRGAFASAAAIPDWGWVMARWHDMYREVAG
jgi:glycosyltransferase involved in cell wall biosynthesis